MSRCQRRRSRPIACAPEAHEALPAPADRAATEIRSSPVDDARGEVADAARHPRARQRERDAAATTTNTASPIIAIVCRAAPSPPVSVSRAKASVGKPRIASWFQIPVSVTASAPGRRGSPRRATSRPRPRCRPRGPGREVGPGGRRLRHRQGRQEAEARQRRHPGRGERDEFSTTVARRTTIHSQESIRTCARPRCSWRIAAARRRTCRRSPPRRGVRQAALHPGLHAARSRASVSPIAQHPDVDLGATSAAARTNSRAGRSSGGGPTAS